MLIAPKKAKTTIKDDQITLNIWKAKQKKASLSCFFSYSDEVHIMSINNAAIVDLQPSKLVRPSIVKYGVVYSQFPKEEAKRT